MHRSEIQIPLFALDMTHGVFLRWLVATGDRVMMGQPLCEVEADDGIYEIENFDYGIVTTMSVEVGRYPVGTVLGYIEFTGEERIAQEFFRERLTMDRPNARLARDFPAPYRMMAGERCHRCREQLQAFSDSLPLCLSCLSTYKHFHCGGCGRRVAYPAVLPDLQPAADRCECSTCLMRKRAAALPMEDREAIRAALDGSVFAGVRVAMVRLGWSLNDANHLAEVLLATGG